MPAAKKSSAKNARKTTPKVSMELIKMKKTQPARSKRKRGGEAQGRGGKETRKSRRKATDADAVDAKVEVRDSVGMGKGLFAAEAIHKGMTVAAIPNPQIVDLNDMRDDSFTKRRNLPHDAVVWKGNTGFFDRRFRNKRSPPLWYRMNHGKRRANVAMRIDKQKMSVKWVSTEDIPPGAELLYNYGVVPSEWAD